MRRARAHLGPVALALPLAFGCHGALVGGECLEGFVAEAGRCVVDPGAGGATAAGGNGGDGGSGGERPTAASNATSTANATTTTASNATSTANTNVTSTADASTSTGVLTCGALAACAAGCVDLSSHPDNCGACGHYCPSGICTDGACEGAPGGHGVFAGFDYGHGQSAMPQVILRNAIALSGRDPIRILDVCSADAGLACDTARAVLAQLANDAGKSAIITPHTLLGAVEDPQALAGADMLVVHQVMADEVVHADTTSPLAPMLRDFAASGRVVAVLGDETYTDGLVELLARSSFLPDASLTLRHGNASVVDFFDALTSGVVSPFAASGAAATVDLGASQDPSLRVVVANDAGAVVVHRAFPPAP